jgi:hypothetical protein
MAASKVVARIRRRTTSLSFVTGRFGPSLRVPHLLLEQHILVTVLRVQLKPLPIIHPSERT